MSMVYIGESHYFDTDDFSDFLYNEFCKHRDNLQKYYIRKDDINFRAKTKLLGIDIDKIIDDAMYFVADKILDCFQDYDYNERPKNINLYTCFYADEIKTAVEAIAYGLEE